MLKVAPVLLFLAAQLTAQSRPERPFSDPELGLSLTVPAGFYDEGSDPTALNTLQCFVKLSTGLAQASLVATLSTVSGETNWLNRSERMEKKGETFGYVAGIVIAIGVGMMIARRRQEN